MALLPSVAIQLSAIHWAPNEGAARCSLTTIRQTWSGRNSQTSISTSGWLSQRRTVVKQFNGMRCINRKSYFDELFSPIWRQTPKRWRKKSYWYTEVLASKREASTSHPGKKKKKTLETARNQEFLMHFASFSKQKSTHHIANPIKHVTQSNNLNNWFLKLPIAPIMIWYDLYLNPYPPGGFFTPNSSPAAVQCACPKLHFKLQIFHRGRTPKPGAPGLSQRVLEVKLLGNHDGPKSIGQ